uniref:Dynein regulatory complex protein 10 n=1 Tax=Bursaphelenchus xylophilus TaxID=6326 RepID=A0A1I7SHD9_BURXY
TDVEPDLELMKEQICLLQTRLNDSDLRARRTAKELLETAEFIEQQEEIGNAELCAIADDLREMALSLRSDMQSEMERRRANSIVSCVFNRIGVGTLKRHVLKMHTKQPQGLSRNVKKSRGV